jgi:hypothetical protein
MLVLRGSLAGRPVAFQPILQRSIREPSFPSNRGKLSTVLKMSQANEMSHFATTRTLSDFPLLIGKMLLRGVGRFEWLCHQRRFFRVISLPNTVVESPSHRKVDYFAALKGSRRHNLKEAETR